MMAEAGVGSSVKTEKKYYCHECNSQLTRTLPEFLCPNCSSGFVEELSETDGSMSDAPAPRTFDSFFESLNPDRDPFELFPLPRINAANDFHHRGRGPRFSMRMTTQSDGNPGPQQSSTSSETPIDQFFQQLFSNLGVAVMERGSGGDVMMHRMFPQNMGDYAWGPNGLDNIISQLLSQLESTGPPPADKDKIESLPKIRISQMHIDEVLECAVCKEAYTTNEEVLKLPCKHLFHPECVKPWLELHDSCPVCRCSLSGESTAIDT